MRELAEAFSVSAEEARADVLRFVWQLNRLALVNIERGTSRLRRLADWVHLAARLAPAGALPASVSRRRALDTRTVSRALVTSVAGVLPRVCLVAGVAAVLAVHFSLILGAGIVIPLLIGLGTGRGARAPRGGARRTPARCPECARRTRPADVRPPCDHQLSPTRHGRARRTADGLRARRRVDPCRSRLQGADAAGRRLAASRPTRSRSRSSAATGESHAVSEGVPARGGCDGASSPTRSLRPSRSRPRPAAARSTSPSGRSRSSPSSWTGRRASRRSAPGSRSCAFVGGVLNLVAAQVIRRRS